jgi:chaperonin GroES
MKLKPLGNRIIIEEAKKEEKTSSGIVLPDTADKEESSQGKVVAVGKGKKVKILGLRIGDRVIYSYGKAIKIDNKELQILDFEEILAKVDK